MNDTIANQVRLQALERLHSRTLPEELWHKVSDYCYELRFPFSDSPDHYIFRITVIKNPEGAGYCYRIIRNGHFSHSDLKGPLGTQWQAAHEALMECAQHIDKLREDLSQCLLAMNS